MTKPTFPSLYAILLLTFLAGGCVKADADYTGLPCDNAGNCLLGYQCQNGICVAEDVKRASGADQNACPVVPEAGTSCPSPGSIVRCPDATACDGGCRTCSDDNTWGDCVPRCEIDQLSPGDCSQKCLEIVQNADAFCDVGTSPPTCNYQGVCHEGYGDADGFRHNGCECEKVGDGIEIACNDLDEDCDGSDLVASGEVTHCLGCGDDCTTKVRNVENVECTPNGCGFDACLVGFEDADGDTTNGCETEQGSEIPEICDGDDDCDDDSDDPASPPPTESDVPGLSVSYVYRLNRKGDINPIDVDLMNRLNDQGFAVSRIRASDFRAADGNAADLVILSDVEGAVDSGAALDNLAKPVLTWDVWSYADLLMSDEHKGDNVDGSRGDLVITDPDHFLAGGLKKGEHPVYSSRDGCLTKPQKKPAKGADIVATDKDDRPVVFVIEAGAPLANDHPAPSVRVGFFICDHEKARLSQEGVTLFDAAVDYALSR